MDRTDRLPLRTTYQAGVVGLVAGGTMRALRFMGEGMEGQRRAMSREVESAVEEGGEERGRVARDDAGDSKLEKQA